MQQLQFIIAVINLNWQTDSRIWNNVVLVSEQYDYANQITTPNVQADVVTVKSLQLYSIQDGNCIYTSMLQVGTNFFKNVLIFLDVDLQVSPKCKNAEISFANSVTGTFTNVSLTGSIRITSTTFVNLNISKFVGHIFNNFVASNCFSNVTFTVNGTAQSTSSGSVTLFETSFDANSITLLASGPTCTLDTKSVTSCSGTYTYKVNQAASAHPGIIKEYYEARFQLLEWKQMRSKYFYLDFDVAGAFTPDVRLSAQRAYYSPGTTKIAVFMADGSILECSQLYDPFSKSCVPTCSGKLFEKFCQGSCPNGSYSSSDSQMCYVMCPTTLGYSLSGTVCTKCSNFAVDLGGCVASCPSTSPVVNGSGCFPRTMVQNTFTEDSCASVCDPGYLMDSTCKAACSDGQIAKSSLRTCVACSSEYNGGPCWKRNGAVCANSCDYLNGTYCEDLGTSKCEYYYLDGSQKKCVHTCPAGYPYLQATEKRCFTTCPDSYKYIENNKYCVSQCVSGNYSISINPTLYKCVGVCPKYSYFEASSQMRVCVQTCATETVNKYFNESTKECLSSCQNAFYKVIDNNIYCLNDCNSNFHGIDSKFDISMERCEISCSLFSSPKVSMDQLCLDKCNNPKPYSADGICVANCYDQSSLKYISEDGLSCVADCQIFRPVSLELQCQSSCSSPDINISYNNLLYCFKDCEEQYFYAPQSTCVDICPSPYVSYQKLCVKSCPSGYSTIQSQCIIVPLKTKYTSYIIIIVSILVIILTILLVVYFTRKRHNQKRKNQSNKNDTMFYANRLQNVKKVKLVKINGDNSELKEKIQTVKVNVSVPRVIRPKNGAKVVQTAQKEPEITKYVTNQPVKVVVNQPVKIEQKTQLNKVVQKDVRKEAVQMKNVVTENENKKVVVVQNVRAYNVRTNSESIRGKQDPKQGRRVQ
ncbi:Conserved_hypothetical protein [Hexamita inflata]|uniref:Uncharacterized protein n=1 Tax=Hexamita inflata TaxID=28002 RepID=A0AA86QDA6_9EUKA|nr:Conserved hypothetical protein [Hexamita inflata]